MTGCAPDYCLLMVGGNAGLIGMSKEHLVGRSLILPPSPLSKFFDFPPLRLTGCCAGSERSCNRHHLQGKRPSESLSQGFLNVFLCV